MCCKQAMFVSIISVWIVDTLTQKVWLEKHPEKHPFASRHSHILDIEGG